MNFSVRTSPNYRDDISTKRIMRELILGLLVVFAFSLYYYSVEYTMDHVVHALLLMLTAVVTAVATETVYALVKKKNVRYHLTFSFPLVTAIILTLMVPVSMTYTALALGTFFAIFVGKLIFGGFGQNIFNPAATGRALILSSFAGATAADVITGATPISTISGMGWLIKDSTLVQNLLDQFGGLQGLFIGWHPGALGETSAALILVVGVVLALRRVLDWRIPVFYIGSAFVMATVIALMNGVGMWYPVYHLVSGGLMFGAVFMATDPVTNPTSAAGRVIFAIGCGILTVLIRVKANVPGGVLYSILIMNMLSPLIERYTDGWQIHTVKKNWRLIAIVAALGIASAAIVGSVMTPAEPSAENPGMPAVTLGDSINLFSDQTSNPPEVVEMTEDGDFVTYTMAAAGYAITEGGSDGAKPNLVEVKLNQATKTVESVAILEANDTPNLGTQIEGKEFIDQFAGISYENNDDATVDSVSGATVSSTSVVKAVRLAIQDLTKE